MPYPHVSHYLPHQGQAVLLDEILDLQDRGLTARLKSFPVETPPLLLIEAAAQAVAALQGARLAGSGQKPRAGYLAGVRDFHWLQPGHGPGPIEVEVREVKSLPPFFLFQADIRQAGRRVAGGYLTVHAGKE